MGGAGGRGCVTRKPGRGADEDGSHSLDLRQGYLTPHDCRPGGIRQAQDRIPIHRCDEGSGGSEAHASALQGGSDRPGNRGRGQGLDRIRWSWVIGLSGPPEADPTGNSWDQMASRGGRISFHRDPDSASAPFGRLSFSPQFSPRIADATGERPQDLNRFCNSNRRSKSRHTSR